MKRMSVILTVSLIASLAFSGPTTAGGGEPDPAGNGIVMMIHMHWEPWVNEVSPVFLPPALEALGATPTDGDIVFHVIPYRASDDLGLVRPVDLSDAKLTLIGATGATTMELHPDPTRPAADQTICQEETQLPDPDGDVEACKVFSAPAEFFTGQNILTARLTFTDEEGDPGVENYNAVAHYLLHGYMESGGESYSLEDADEQFTQRTPMVIQNLVEV